MCQVSCSNAAVVCVDSARWRLPPRSTTSCSSASSSAPCTFLIQHLWVVFWPASPGTWMRVRLDLSWLWTPPPIHKRALSQWSHPGWPGVVPRHSVIWHEVFSQAIGCLLSTSSVSLLDICGLLCLWMIGFASLHNIFLHPIVLCYLNMFFFPLR